MSENVIPYYGHPAGACLRDLDAALRRSEALSARRAGELVDKDAAIDELRRDNALLAAERDELRATRRNRPWWAVLWLIVGAAIVVGLFATWPPVVACAGPVLEMGRGWR